jgi:hypothetical protein
VRAPEVDACLGTPGALCAAADFPQSPTGLAQEYSKRQSLTVLLRQRVEIISVRSEAEAPDARKVGAGPSAPLATDRMLLDACG